MDFEYTSRDSKAPLEGQVFVVSDFTGETASQVVRAALRQFPDLNLGVRRFRDVSTPEAVHEICDLAAQEGAVIACTLVDKKCREAMAQRAKEKGVALVELFGPLLDALSSRFGAVASGVPGSQQALDEEYFRRVKAIEFSSACDDGASPALLPEADLVILGVSRTCKTPLSMYLANKGLRTANIPLVPELEAPQELFCVEGGKIIGLTIKAEALQKIRRDRLVMLGLDPDKANYARIERVQQELDHAKALCDKLGAQMIDVTGRALEETAQEILELLRSRGQNNF